MAGHERDSVSGILLSMELAQNVAAKQERLAKTNKGKQQQRRSRMYSKNPQYRK